MLRGPEVGAFVWWSLVAAYVVVAVGCWVLAVAMGDTDDEG